ncbi:transcriptional regulator [Actinomadura craniellae]|uniref:Transcriptional regulator n=1 Tax=Actinomadura craniellae TaxID=2231787 RepID=A0A365H6J5_9ACTN|nr:helix-turn-helix transcriptional regulator [Actinomadura craniellae]RAY14622.1 transcriptional regulator [Actinomadura craniellae]
MPESTSIGARLKRLRRAQSLTQEQLAEAAGVSVDLVAKLEQGRRETARITSLIALANALDVELSELVGKRPRLGTGEDGRFLAVRDVLLSPDALPGLDPLDNGEPPALDAIEQAIGAAWGDYWAGRLTRLAATVPGLIGESRLAIGAYGTAAAGVLAQSYQLAACLLVHLGKDDLAVIGAERAVAAAAAGDDELRWVTLHGTYAWCLLHQGRTEAAERHAVRVAERTEPVISKAAPPHLTVWGGLLLTAMAAAAAGGRSGPAGDYIGLARSAAGRFDHDRLDYQVTFGPTQVAVQATHAGAVLREPARALKAARQVRRDDLPPVAYGRHLVDVAQAHLDARHHRTAETTLLEAEAISTEWFRHQGPARAMIAELVRETTRLSAPLRRLARAVEAN